MASPIGFIMSPGAARKFQDLTRAKYDQRSRKLLGAKASEQDIKPRAFTVQYSTENEAFLVYLPTEGEYLNYGGSPLRVAGLVAATGYPSGWYKLPDGVPGENHSVYLAIGSSAQFVAERDASRLCVLIAKASKGAEGLDVQIDQLFSGALIIAGGGGSSPSGGFAFTGDKIAEGAVCFGREFFPVAAKTFASGESPDGFWCVKCAMSSEVSPRATIEKVAALLDMFAAPSDDYCYIPLFVIEGGAVVTDYRGASTVTLRE